MNWLGILLALALITAATTQAAELSISDPISIAGRKIYCPRPGTRSRAEVKAEDEFKAKIHFDQRLNTNSLEALYQELQNIPRSDKGYVFARAQTVLFQQDEYPLRPESKIDTEDNTVASLAEFLKLQRAHPDNYQIYFVLKRLREGEAKRELLWLLRCATRLNPDFQEFELSEEAFVYARAGEPDTAFKLWEKLDPRHISTIAYLTVGSEIASAMITAEYYGGRSYRKELRQFENVINQVVDSHPDDWRALNLKVILLQDMVSLGDNRWEDFARANSRLRQVDDVNARPYTNAGRIAFHREDWHEAEKMFALAWRKNRGRTLFIAQMAMDVELKLGRPEGVSEWAKRVIGFLGNENIQIDGSVNLVVTGMSATNQLPALIKIVQHMPASRLRTDFECTIGTRGDMRENIFSVEELNRRLPACRKIFSGPGRFNYADQMEFMTVAYGSYLRHGEVDRARVLLREMCARPLEVSIRVLGTCVSEGVRVMPDPKFVDTVIEKIGRSTSQGTFLIASRLHAEKKYAEGMAILDTLSTNDMSSALAEDFRSLRARFLSDLGRPQEAFAILHSQSADSLTQDNISDQVDYLRKYSSPKATLNFLEAHTTPTSHKSTWLYNTWSQLLFEVGRKEEGLAKMKEALALYPLDETLWANLAATYAKDFHDCKSARPVVEKAATIAISENVQGLLMDLMLKCGIPTLKLKVPVGSE